MTLINIDEKAFLAVIWAAALTAFPFVPFRFYVRYRVFGKIFADDVLVLFSTTLLLTFAGFWQTRADDLYNFINMAAGRQFPGSHSDATNSAQRLQQAEVMTVVVYGVSIWCIKLAFLLFFRRLGDQVRHLATVWWSILAFNVATFIVWMSVKNWRCFLASPAASQATCNDPRTMQFNLITLKVETAMDVTSDMSIIIIPAILLWRITLPLKKKLALSGIFGLTLFVIAASISRITVVSSTKAADLAWYIMGSSVEIGVAIIVACLSSYRALFSHNPRLPRYQSDLSKPSQNGSIKRSTIGSTSSIRQLRQDDEEKSNTVPVQAV